MIFAYEKICIVVFNNSRDGSPVCQLIWPKIRISMHRLALLLTSPRVRLIISNNLRNKVQRSAIMTIFAKRYEQYNYEEVSVWINAVIRFGDKCSGTAKYIC